MLKFQILIWLVKALNCKLTRKLFKALKRKMLWELYELAKTEPSLIKFLKLICLGFEIRNVAFRERIVELSKKCHFDVREYL